MQRLTKLWNYERYSVPYKESGRYFYTRNDGLQPQSVLYTMKTLKDTPRVLLDPNTLAADGTVALAGTAVSPDGKLLAYGTAASGSDWNEWKVRDIDTGKDLTDHLKWVKFSQTAWTKDGKGFFYSRYDEPKEATKLADVNYFQKLYYHKVGTPQSADTLVYDRADQKEWGFGAEVTDDGKYLLITATKGTAPKYRMFYKDLTRADSKVVALVDEFEASYDFIDNDGPVMYFATDKDAPRKRIVAIDVRKPAASELEAGRAGIERNADGRQPAQQPAGHRVPGRRAQHGQGLRPQGQGRARNRAAGHRIGIGLQRQAQGQRDLLLVHRLHQPDHHLPPRPEERQEHGIPPAEGRLRPEPATRRASSSTPAATAPRSRCSSCPRRA